MKNSVLEAALSEARKAFGNIRPIHKQNLATARLNAEKDKKHPGTMTVFHKREKAGEIPAQPLRKPEHSKGLVAQAAGAMADWDHSDPFSYGRTALHVRQGYLDPKDVIKEMGQRTLARRVAKSREVEAQK